MTPEEFIQTGPQSVADLIGPAKKIAQVLTAKAAANDKGTPIRILLSGDPGCGKSSIARLVAKSLHPVLTSGRISGQSVTAEMVREWLAGGMYLHQESWTIRIVEEADLMSPAAQALVLQYIDEMPPFHALLCTSNKSMGELSDRFQSRFQAVPIGRPKDPDELLVFIRDRWPDITCEIAVSISESFAGDIRAALNDAQSYLDEMMFTQ